MAGYKSASDDKVPDDEWIRPTTWPPRKSVLERGPDAPHVVLSTKFQEPWKTISIGVKEILEELGCTVYNPNTDNKARWGAPINGLKAVESELWKEEADSRWLLTFQENLDRIEQSKRGFVLQIQQGGFTGCEDKLALAVQKAREQWEQGVKDEVQMVSECFEPIGGDRELPVNDQGEIHGRARCTWPNGDVYEGDYKDGKRNGTGTHTLASGAVYVGECKDKKRNGKGTYTYKNGAVEVGFYEDNKDPDKGRGVRLSADGKKAWLLMDGEVEREVSVAEARKVAEELGLPPLP
ncbi:RSPH1 [Symbiodinium sp. CCMP2592]|nr:RSPH1 [Symbiodinium sp. CCMP2592]